MTNRIINDQTRWPAPKKLLLLFILSYLFFYMFPFPLDMIPVVKKIVALYSKGIEAITLWIGHSFLGMPGLHKIEDTGSGDTSFDYVRLITLLLLSVITTVVLFIFTAKQANYTKLSAYVRIYARYYVGLFMVIYGLAKVYGGQFGYPGFSQLEKTYGESSPMNLLWTFMGYSKPYAVFSGIGEITGGVLLFFRRTTVLGCIVTITVMLNVAMLNFSYDVPVKLFSTHLVLITLFIVWPAINRLIDFFFRGKPSKLNVESTRYAKKWMKPAGIALKILLIAGIPLFDYLEQAKFLKTLKVKTELDGMYKTEVFVYNRNALKDTLPPLVTDTVRWDHIIVRNGYMLISPMSGGRVYYHLDADTVKHTMTLKDRGTDSTLYVLTYKLIPGQLLLTGLYDKDSVEVTMKKKALNEYLLVNRGFHWINEYPFNR